ncbi:hypothetical protein OV203_30420 [Nannocystis sp. ILAH1]|uniref:DUF3592 domain-containing protein n=1 Tax=unclassified Nannocystis TaxID=2627009 RepID=UPI002270F345|nr:MULTISPECIES: DUF3592 domain-containing protein [unclassified Nannocystis]MCY0991496.1 hypothetical protein [Nannocystis sp. ILAH1]MCY1066545.1 hypothetical protein [Nannocystis sp. RBIL2]
MFEMVAVFVGFGLFLWLLIALLTQGKIAEAEHDQLRASGTKATGTILAVGAGRVSSRQGSLQIYSRPVTLKVALPTGEAQIEANIVVPEMLQSLLIAGAPCEVIVDPAKPGHVCITAIGNAFGVNTPVDLGTHYSRW